MEKRIVFTVHSEYTKFWIDARNWSGELPQAGDVVDIENAVDWEDREVVSEIEGMNKERRGQGKREIGMEELMECGFLVLFRSIYSDTVYIHCIPIELEQYENMVKKDILEKIKPFF
jgi:hypothetical protein